jgi:endonuclease YncB( thermonuclease family)
MTSIAIITAAILGSSQVAGQASVIDADTLEVQGERVRLVGIDAPESAQWCEDCLGERYPCGRNASFVLDDLLSGKRVRGRGRGPIRAGTRRVLPRREGHQR